jgi:hypothetical protein
MKSNSGMIVVFNDIYHDILGVLSEIERLKFLENATRSLELVLEEIKGDGQTGPRCCTAFNRAQEKLVFARRELRVARLDFLNEEFDDGDERILAGAKFAHQAYLLVKTYEKLRIDDDYNEIGGGSGEA